jgi:hypothetical protein
MEPAGWNRHARQDQSGLECPRPGAALDYLGNARLTRRGCGSLARRSVARMGQGCADVAQAGLYPNKLAGG